MHALRRAIAVAGLSVMTIAGFLALAEQPAQAAGVHWYVATAANGGNDLTPNCGTTPATPCRTVAFTYNKAAVNDIINVRPGTYLMTGGFGAVANGTNRLNLTKGMIIQRDPAFAGEGAVVFDANNVPVANGSIAVVNTPGATLTLRDVTIQRGVTGFLGLGSGLYSFAGTTVLENVTFDQNKAATGAGGALFVAAGTTVNATGGSFTANSAASGGAVGVQAASGATPRGIASFNGTTFTGNTAVGVNGTVSGQGGAIYNLGQTTLTGGTVSGSSATPFAALLGGSGGAIYSTGTLTVTGTTISGNTAKGVATTQVTGLGGGIFQNAPGNVTITGATISGNAATMTGAGTAGTFSALGGGLFNGGAGSSIAASTITGNSVAGSTPATTGIGGGLWNQGTLTLNDTDVTNNTATAGAAATTGRGGGAFNGNGGGASLTVGNGSSVTGNQATAGAGAFSGQGGGIWNEATLVVDASSVSSNTAAGSGAGGASVGKGGGIFNSALATASATVRNGSSVNGNTASGGTAGSTGLGGGIANERNLTITDSTLDGNTATGAAAGSGLGGGIYSQYGLSVTGSDLTGNDAVGGAGDNSGRGGGIDNAFGVAVITGTSVSGGSASGTGAGAGQGGGIDNFAGNMTIDGGNVSTNAAALGGGISNILAPGFGSLTIKGGTVVDQNTALAGGGFYTTGAGTTVSLTDANISDNDARSGGGIWNNGSTITGLRLALDDNSATAVGSNTGLGGGMLNSGTTTLTEGSIAGNTATGAAATVSGLGGGAFNNGSLTVNRTGVHDNDAVGTAAFQTGWGGAFYNGGNGANTNATLVIDQSTLATNTAQVGGAIIGYAPGATSSAKTSIERSTVTDNTTTAAGGGWYIGSTGASLSVVETTVAGNGSGLVQNGTSTANLSGSILHDNGTASCTTGSPATLVDGGHNLAAVGDTSCFPAGNGNVFGDPALGALADNGGFTPTLLPGPSSAALDKVPGNEDTGVNNAVTGNQVVLCDIGNEDQRGVTRPQGELCDIGSVELEQVAPTIDGPTAGQFTVGVAGDPVGPYTATGSPTPTFSATGLPSGLSLTENPDGTASITGTPAVGTGGVHQVTVTATNEAGEDSILVEITVLVPPVVIETTTLPNGAYHVPYAATITATGGTGSYTFTVDSGALPAGLTLNPDGTITGSPNAVGTFNFTVKATDVGEPTVSDTQALSITVERGPTNLVVSKVLITSGPFGIKLGVVDATLRGGVPLLPIAGQTITFTAGATTVCTAVTNANGVAGCSMSALNTVQVILNGGVTATYAGNTVWLPTSGSAGLL